ncbi:MAG: RNA methyltransferase [Bacteroidota bacterium]
MVSRTLTKFIKSLQLKKYRKLEQLFLVEGEKSVVEVLRSTFKVQQLFVTLEFQKQYQALLSANELTVVSERELASLGSFKSNNSALAVVKMAKQVGLNVDQGFSIALDSVNDPGNLGTIIRIADWYGIDKIIASKDTADLYNPKVISASKGSFTRVRVHYVDLKTYLQKLDMPIYGAFISGESIHDVKFEESGVIVMGNESQGISDEVNGCISKRISIPKFGGAESLNVGVATAVICDNLKRSLT